MELPIDFVQWFLGRHGRQPMPAVAAYPDGEAWLVWQAAQAAKRPKPSKPSVTGAEADFINSTLAP